MNIQLYTSNNIDNKLIECLLFMPFKILNSLIKYRHFISIYYLKSFIKNETEIF